MPTAKARKPKRKPRAKPANRAAPKKVRPAQPKPPRGKSHAEYDAWKQQQANISRARSTKGREIGEIPEIDDVERRESCRYDFKLFCETYNPEAFYLGWSDGHLKAIARIEEAALQGALFAFAMPRGDGKTTISRMGSLWAKSYNHCRYAFLIGANSTKAEDSLDALRIFVRYLPLYAADFPEISFPARCLAGIANRAAGQTCRGESTLIEWAKDMIVFPTVPAPKNWPKHWPLRSDGMVPTGGGILSASGLTGEGIRGSLKTLMTGEQVRPDFVLLDDPQTDESARSPVQNQKRLQLISSGVLGMAGAGKPISAVMPCTVIERGDMADQILDRVKHPLWRGERTRMLKRFPKNMPAWELYFDVYRKCAQAEPPDYTESNAYYDSHVIELEEGAEASWPQRKQEWERSAIQSAMHLFCRDRRGFMSEYQNDPEAADLGADAKELQPAEVAKRFNGVERYRVPRECSTLTAFFDVGIYLHFYLVVAWNEHFGGAVIDYGSWPHQNRDFFLDREARPSLRDKYPGLKDDQLVYAGLSDMVPEVLGRKYFRDDTGGEMAIEKALVDSGEQQAAVYKYVRASGFHGILFPSKGIGRSATSAGVQSWAPRDGEKRGHYWRMTKAERESGRVVQFDTDEWKSQAYGMLTTPQGGRSGLTLWGKDASTHDMFSHHCAGEYSTFVTIPTKGLKFHKFTQKPDRPNIHLWDCLIGNAVAASVAGLMIPTTTAAEKKAEPSKRLSQADIDRLQKTRRTIRPASREAE